jgi:hypothetical protein
VAIFGSILVLLSYRIIGMLEEINNFGILFNGISLVAINFLWQMPVIGALQSLPGVNLFAD